MTKIYANFADYPQDKWRWPDFTPSEIACRGTGKLLVDERAMDLLQELRNRIGKPMHVNSGYRSPEHNRAVGGATNSKHMQGIAFDVRMSGHDPQVFMATARDVGFKGIGEYPVLGFCHIDAREAPAHWLGSRGVKFPGAKADPARAAQATPQASPATPAPVAPETKPSPLAGILALLARIFGGKKDE